MKISQKSQILNLINRETVRVVIVENSAYWVHDNGIYKADIVNEKIDLENANKIDAFSLSEKETTVLLDILDSIEKE